MGWLYLFYFFEKRTNPCTHLAVLNVTDFLEPGQDLFTNDLNKLKSNNLLIHDIIKCHRAIAYDLDYLNKNEKAICFCIGLLDSEVTFWNVNGSCTPPCHLFLLLGLDVLI